METVCLTGRVNLLTFLNYLLLRMLRYHCNNISTLWIAAILAAKGGARNSRETSEYDTRILMTDTSETVTSMTTRICVACPSILQGRTKRGNVPAAVHPISGYIIPLSRTPCKVMHHTKGMVLPSVSNDSDFYIKRREYQRV